MLICGALPPEEHKYLRGVKGFSDAELRLITSWQDPPPWGQATPIAPPGQGKFLIKVGDRPGIPFHLTLTRHRTTPRHPRHLKTLAPRQRTTIG